MTDSIRARAMRRVLSQAAVSAAAAALLVSGCAVGPDYERPSAPEAAAWKEAAPQGWKSAAPADAQLKGRWWELYGDEELNGLMARVSLNNQTIARYVARYDQAMALLSGEEAGQMPQVTGSASATRSRARREESTSASVAGAFSWELDLWGKLRRSVARQSAQVDATVADLANAELSAQASLARAYFQVRVLDERIALYDKTIKVYRENVRVIGNKYREGAVVKSDLTQAQQSLASAQSSRAGLVAQRAQYEHAAAVLCGEAPAGFSIPRRGAGRLAVPPIPVGVPSRLLERRPDIASAERAVAAANEAIGIAIAGYFPDLTISGRAGWSGDHFSSLISADQFVWSLGASVAGKIFDFGRTKAQVASSRAAYAQTVASYRQTVLSAFQDVEDALTQASSLEQQLRHTGEFLAAAAETARIKRNQYNEGMIDYTEAAASEAARLSAEQNLMSLRAQALTNSVTLIEALGGGWEGLGR